MYICTASCVHIVVSSLLLRGLFHLLTVSTVDAISHNKLQVAVMIAFQAKQLQLNKSLLDEAIEPYETTLAISRVSDSMEARGISYEDKDALLEVCEEIVHELALEVNAKDIFTIMIDVEVMETYSNTEYMEQEEETS